MLAREYNKRVSIYQTTKVPDGFGGNTVAEVLLFSSWAKLETNGVGYKAKDFGLQEFNDPLLFKVRFRHDFDYNSRTMFLTYKNDRYIIQGIRNSDEADIELEIFCKKQTQ